MRKREREQIIHDAGDVLDCAAHEVTGLQPREGQSELAAMLEGLEAAAAVIDENRDAASPEQVEAALVWSLISGDDKRREAARQVDAQRAADEERRAELSLREEA